MPCNQERRVTVHLGRMDAALLRLASLELGIGQVSAGGRLSLPAWQNTPETLAKIKREYSRQAVLTQAKRFGWTVTESKPYQFQVTKR